MRKTAIWRLLLIAAIICFSASTALGADAGSKGTLTVLITDFPTSDGYAMLALSDTKSAYEQGQEKAYATKRSKVENASATAVFENLPFGEYGVSLYQDQNSNGQMDKNAMGIPKEPYAFSNNARAMFKKPAWEKVKFDLQEAEKTITISFKE